MEQPRPVQPDFLEFLSSVPALGAFSDNELSQLAESLVRTPFQFGQTLLSQGTFCDGLYVVHSGSIRLFAHENGREISMGLRKAGDSFAEANFLRDSPIDCTARAAGKGELLLIPRAALIGLWQQNPKSKEYMIRYAAVKTAGGLVARLFDLKREFEKKDFESLIETIGIKRVDTGQIVLRQDTFDDRRLYVIRNGRVRVVRQEGEHEFPIAVLGNGETFGERALLFADNQPANVVTERESTFLVIPDTTVKTILERHPKLRASFEDRIHAFEQELERQRKLRSRKVGRWHFSPVVQAKSGEKILDRFPLVEQEEEMDCGAACLAMICRYHGVQTTLEQLRDMADIDQGGATLESLAVTAERLGFIARGMHATFVELMDFELPVLVHWQNYHYVVIFGLTPNLVYVADPATGFKQMTRTEFEKGWNGTCLVLERDGKCIESTAMLASPRQDAASFDIFKSLKPWLAPVVGTALFFGLLSVLPPLLIRYWLETARSSPGPEFFVLGFFALSGLLCLSTLMRELLAGRLKSKVVTESTSELMQRILYQPLDFFERRKISDLLDRFRDHDRLWNFLTARVISQLGALSTLVFSWLALVCFNAPATLTYIAIHLPILFLLRLAERGLSIDNRAESSADGLKDFLDGIESIKAQGAEYWMRCRWEDLSSSHSQAYQKQAQQSAYLLFSIRIVQAIAFTFLLWKATDLFRSGQFSVGELIATVLLAALSLQPLAQLSQGWLEWLSVRPGFRRVRSIGRLPPEQNSTQTAENIILPELRGQFSLRNLYFRYQQHAPYILEGLDCEIESGQWISFIGASGSGKTTLAKLLIGFYSCQDGRLEVDGYPAELLEKGSYRRQIGYLPQKPFLVPGSLLDNVAFGVRAPQRKRIVDACRLVELHERISQLPAGYEYPVAEMQESQWWDLAMRIGAARALYREPSVLILDQALCALDFKAESDILKRIRKTYPKNTMITFSERVNPKLAPDRIFLLYQGRIAESGSPAELKDRSSLYNQMLTSQVARA